MCFLFGEQYEGAAAPFRVFLLLLPVRTITFGAVLQATGQSRPILISSILTLAANAVLGWFAIGWIGPIGACLGLRGFHLPGLCPLSDQGPLFHTARFRSRICFLGWSC